MPALPEAPTKSALPGRFFLLREKKAVFPESPRFRGATEVDSNERGPRKIGDFVGQMHRNSAKDVDLVGPKHRIYDLFTEKTCLHHGFRVK